MYKEKPTYRSEIISALRLLGGQGSLKNICTIIEERNLLEYIHTNPNWEANVRTTIQRHSSDTKSYNGAEDVFFSVEGLLGGIWGIRDDKLLMSEETFDFIAEGEYSENEIFEGAQKQLVVNTFERDQSLRKQSIEIYGIRCNVCNFCFEDTYGIRGQGFIEVHHIVPLHIIRQQYAASPYDLIPVCSNCHSMIHRFKPFLTMEEIRDVYNMRKQAV